MPVLSNRFNPRYPVRGFTLIEVIAGIVVLGIMAALLSSVYFSQMTGFSSAQFTHESTMIARSLMAEMKAAQFDDANIDSDRPCDESSCTSADALGPEPGERFSASLESESMFDDFDDYHGLTISGDEVMRHPLFNNHYANVIKRFQPLSVRVNVFYDGDFDMQADNEIRPVKAAEIEVTAADGTAARFQQRMTNRVGD